MATFEKDILYPGTYKLRDGREVKFTAERAKKLSDRMSEMLNAGLQIPLTWEHQPSVKPATATELAAAKAERAKLTLGHAAKAELSPEGFVKATVDVPVDDDAKKLPALRFVSPFIEEDWTDGNGKQWPGESITHLAVTPRP